MQLVLVDTSNFSVFEAREATATLDSVLRIGLKKEDFLSSGILKRKRDHDCEEERIQLASELFADVISLVVYFKLIPSRAQMKGYEVNQVEVNLIPFNPSSNILKQWWDRFQDNIKFSVFTKYAYGEKDAELQDFVSIKGFTILDFVYSGQFSCSGRSPTTVIKFDKDLESKNLHLKVVADIPDHIVFANDIPYAKVVLEKKKFSDVTIVTGSGAEVKAHKCFLSVCSSVLQAMFDNDMEESNTGRVDMTDISEAGVKAFLRYVYYSDLKIPEENIEVAFQVLYAAHKYNVRGLEARMVKCLVDRKNEDFGVGQVFKIYMFTRNLESTLELKKKAVRVLKTQVDQLESLKEYKDLYLKPSNANIAMELFRDLAKLSESEHPIQHCSSSLYN